MKKNLLLGGEPRKIRIFGRIATVRPNSLMDKILSIRDSECPVLHALDMLEEALDVVLDEAAERASKTSLEKILGIDDDE